VSDTLAVPFAQDHPRRGETVLEVIGLRVEFRLHHGNVHAVNGLSYRLAAGETLAIVGESGSGKSVSAQAVLGLIEPPGFVTGGQILYRGTDLLRLSEEERRVVRG
jgi:oligopeptide transport system ATP-binding protein